MRFYWHRWFLGIVLLVFLPIAASAGTFMEVLQEYARSHPMVILLHRPDILRGTDLDPFEIGCPKFTSEDALVKQLGDIGYRCTKSGSILACQFEGTAKMKGLFLLSRREYETLIAASHRLVVAFRPDVERGSLFSERLIDSFSEEDHKRLKTGFPVASFTPGQRLAMDNWIINAAFSLGADRISESFAINNLLQPDNELSIKGDLLLLHYNDGRFNRSVQVWSSAGDSSVLPFCRKNTLEDQETLGHLAERVRRATSYTVTVDENIRQHELTVLGPVERAAPVTLMQSAAALGEWVCTADAGRKHIEIRGKRTNLNNRSVGDIDPVLRGLIGEYNLRALYGPDPRRTLEEITSNQMASRDYDIRTDAIREAPMRFKRILMMGLLSDLGRFTTPRFRVNELTERERTLLLAMLATDIYSTVGPQQMLILPPWYPERNAGTLFADFYQDGKFMRSNVKLRLPIGDKVEEVCYSEGTLYHPDLGR